jgi:alpha-tubulin suppressor-like RCC1 family protein
VVSTTLNDATAVSAGSVSCAIRQNATVSCWGSLGHYALGQPTDIESRAALQVPGLAGVVGLETGLDSVCAVLSDGTTRCWGDDGWGQLGDGQITDPKVIIDNGTTDVVAIAMGVLHACAVHRDGTVSCWGGNTNGQLGNGTVSATGISKPTKVPGLTGVVAVSAGGSFTCALGSDTRVRCWGANSVGQLGIGTTSANSLTPVVVKSATP